jgi:hypothetical protein
MPTAQRGKIQVELDQTFNAYAVMTDSGDHQIFTLGTLWSEKVAPAIRPNGISSGRNLLSPHADSDKVAIAAFSAYSKGVEYDVDATSLEISRPTVSTHKISSVTMDEDGNIEEVEGTEGSSFSTTRDAAGGPPLIPVDSVELGQVWMDAQAENAFDEDEIYQSANSHAEYASNPAVEYNTIGKGSYADSAAEKNAHVKLSSAAMVNHTGSVCKRIYLQYYTPSLTTLLKVTDFVPSEVGVSKSSETMYEGSGVSGAIGAMKADSIGDLTFTVFGDDGITEGIVEERGSIITVKWFPDANKVPYLLTQGMLGIEREYPPGGQIKINCTIYCERESVEFIS